jgi:hypothetical protein
VTGGSLVRSSLTVAGFAAAGSLVLAIAGCSLSIGGLQHRTSTYTIGSRVTTLAVMDQAGDVHITGGNSDATSVTEHISFHGTAPTTTHRAAAGILTLNGNCPATETCTVGYTITVPRMTTVRVTDAAGSVAIGSLSGQVTAHVNAGRISLNSLAGPVDAASDAGSIGGLQLTSARASLHVSAGQIDVTFSAPATAITATTDVGAITVRVPATVRYHVTTSATVGSVHISVTHSAAAARTITASTKTGSITIEPSP